MQSMRSTTTLVLLALAAGCGGTPTSPDGAQSADQSVPVDAAAAADATMVIDLSFDAPPVVTCPPGAATPMTAHCTFGVDTECYFNMPPYTAYCLCNGWWDPNVLSIDCDAGVPMDLAPRPDIAGCHIVGGICTAASQCCSGRCLNGTCAPILCGTEGAPCNQNGDCCSASCIQGACGPECGADGTPCLAAAECCTAQCNLGQCGCLLAGVAGCFINAQCCSNKCVNGMCN
jgi:hypothetical protein